MSDPFVLFGAAHLIAIIMAFAAPAILAAFTRKTSLITPIRIAFAGLLIATWALWLWLIFARGWQSLATLLPMNLCDWAAIATIITLLHPNQRSYELSYFWALGGTLQALLTPDLHAGFPDLRFDIFFLFHTGIIASVLYLTLAANWRPYPSSLPRVALWSLLYLLTALTTNAALGSNFGYLNAKPPGPSLLDLLAPWPWYIGELIALALLTLLLCYAPFHLTDRILVRARRNLR